VNPAELRRDDPRPLWRQLADRLRADIAVGTLPPNARLPVEQELGEIYGISRITVRQAMQQLLDEGLVDHKQGKGTFVVSRVVRHDLAGLTGIIDQMRAQGLSPQTSVISFAADSAPPPIAERLGTGCRRVVHYRRLYRLEGVPFGLADIFLPVPASRIQLEEIEAMPAYDLVTRKLGWTIHQAALSICAEAAGAETAILLDVQPGEPLMRFERMSYSVGHEPLEHTRFWVRSGSYEFHLDVSGALPIGTALRTPEAHRKSRPARNRMGEP